MTDSSSRVSPRILIVDDEPAVLALIRDILETDGYQVTDAADGQECLDQISAESFQLVILDIMMPGVSGLDILKTIRSGPASDTNDDDWDPAVPVILLTAATDDETTWAGWSSGANVFLSKPFDSDTLLSWVARTVVHEKEEPSALSEWNPSVFES
jgi:two-component system alkaline phosphatase synthesis response regulator PhoP/two-component system response regulator VicR